MRETCFSLSLTCNPFFSAVASSRKQICIWLVLLVSSSLGVALAKCFGCTITYVHVLLHEAHAPILLRVERLKQNQLVATLSQPTTRTVVRELWTDAVVARERMTVHISHALTPALEIQVLVTLACCLGGGRPTTRNSPKSLCTGNRHMLSAIHDKPARLVG